MGIFERFQDDLKLKEELDNEVKELYITSKFPPLNDVSGIVFSKRIMVENRKVDVLCSDLEGDKDNDFNALIDNFIEDKLLVDGDYVPNSVPGINYFRKEGMDLINELGKKYERVISRTWALESHFLALDYKLENPDVTWVAEFSDPLRVDMENKFRDNHPFEAEEEYFSKLNDLLSDINKETFGGDTDKYFPEIHSGDELYFLVEYLPFLFADVIRFTNYNQREIMLNSFPVDIKEFVFAKSEVSVHPTMDKEFYFLKSANYEMDANYLNMAYFGTYVGKRHLEYLFKSFEELTPEVRSKIKLHLFVPNPENLNMNLAGLDVLDNIEIGNKLPFLQFLNLTTKMDVLIVNDTLTEGTFDINPFLPSKVSDYLGSGSDIWYVCEKGSSMDSNEAKYKSYIDDYDSSRDALGKIVHDKLNVDEVFDRLLGPEYYQDRLTNLNNALHQLYGQRLYWHSQSGLLRKNFNQLSKDFDVKTVELDELTDKYEVLLADFESKSEKLDAVTEDCDSLIEEVQLKDDSINSLKEDIDLKEKSIDSLSEECNSLKESVRSKDKSIVELSDKLEAIQNNIKELENQLDSVTSQRDDLAEEYEELHRITRNSFDLLETKEKIIDEKNKELDYYKSNKSSFGNSSSPLSRIYLFFSSSGDERELNRNLYECLKKGDWFDAEYYISENKDLSNLKWNKILSPELHYVCFGFDENRQPNRNAIVACSKRELLKKLTNDEDI